MSATCSSCGAEIVWATTTRGKLIPLDRDPHPTGNLALSTPHTKTRAACVEQAPADWEGPRYVSHFATCPNAQQHRKEKSK